MKKQYLFIDGYNLLFRMKEYGLIKSSTFPAERDMLIDIIVVSDDNDERDMALGYGAILRDCHRFIKELKERKQTVSKLTKNHNSRNLKNRHIRMSEETQKKLKNFLENGEF